MENEIKNLLSEQTKTFEAFKERIDSVEKYAEKMEARMNRGEISAGGGALVDDSKAFSNIIGHAIDASGMHEYVGAFNRYVRAGTPSNALEVGTPEKGGILCPPALEKRIQDILTQFSPMRNLATVTPINAQSLDIPVENTELAAAWVSETGARNASTTPELSKVSIKAYEMYTMPQATQQMLEDSEVNIEEYLGNCIGRAFGKLEGPGWIAGTGDSVGTPTGILTGTPNYVATGRAGQWAASAAADSLLDMVYALKPEDRAMASFLMNRTTMAQVRKMKDGNGQYLWQPSNIVGQPSSFAGFPVFEDENMPAIAAESLSIAFGNWKRAYRIVDRRGLTILRDPYSSKPYVNFYATKRTSGKVTDKTAYVCLKFSAA